MEDFPPTPWPENVLPTDEELGDWLVTLTSEQRAYVLRDLRSMADRGRACFMENHDNRLARLESQLAENAGEQEHPAWTNREQSPLSQYVIEIWHPQVHRQFGEDDCPWCNS
jgi:hypothetical protein